MLEDTNDIAFTAVTVGEGASVEPGVWFRLGARRHHRPPATSPATTGVLLRPEDAFAVADAIVRVFIAHGDRTDRKKARLKYVLDAWGFDKFLAEVEEKLGKPLRASRRAVRRRAQPPDTARRTSASIAQKQAGHDLGRRGAAGRPLTASRCAASPASRASWATATSA